MGDPEAVTIAGQDLDALPKLPRELAERLLRTGYLRVDRRGFFAKDAYVSATDIDRVVGDTVHLDVDKDMLLAERS
jgi:hypothetical protein